MGDPGFIPPVTSFFHDEDAHSTGSSVTTSDGKHVISDVCFSSTHDAHVTLS